MVLVYVPLGANDVGPGLPASSPTFINTFSVLPSRVSVTQDFIMLIYWHFY